jgi:hypothetical protein
MLGEPAAFHAFAPIWTPLFWELPMRSADELLSAEEAFLHVLAIVRVEDADQAEFERVFHEALKRIFATQETNHVRWADLIYFMIGWITHRRPAEDRTHLFQLAQDLATNSSRREEVKNMVQTYADVLLAEGERKGRIEGKLEGRVEGKLEGKLEGQTMTARRLLVSLGKNKFGSADSVIEAAVDAIADVDRLERMANRVLHASSWTEILATP